MKAILVVNNRRYVLSELNLTGLDILALRKATGLSVRDLFAQAQENCDLDTVATVMWLTRRTEGELDLALEEIAASINYSTNFEFEDEEGPIEPPERLGGGS